jgi:hypothetical protein
MANDRVTVPLGWPRHDRRAEALASQRLAWQAPVLPRLPEDVPRRGVGAGGWAPLGTVLLARHRAPNGHVKFSNTWFEPRGYRLDRLLGFVQQDPQPSTRQLTRLDDEIVVGDSHSEVPPHHVLLGHVEQLPFVLLVPLELRRLHGTGQMVLVGDERDPMRWESDPVAHVGWMEAAPVEPLGPIEHTAEWMRSTLVRRLDRAARRHVYETAADGVEPGNGAARLGGLWSRPGGSDAFVALERTVDGRLLSELAVPRTRRPTLGQGVRWLGAPVRWAGPRWSGRAVAGRAVGLATGTYARPTGGAERREVVGWLRRDPTDGCSPLFSATHPVVGDQFVTRSESEASDLGYLVDGVLGHVSDERADRPPAVTEIPWASRFGRERRYIEGPLAGSS